MKALRNILEGAACGVLFVSAFYWSLVLTWLVSFHITNSDAAIFAVATAWALLVNALLGFLLAADSLRHVLLKWLVSLPAAVLTFLAYRQSVFLYYWLNRISPGYGDLTAGGGFAAFVYLIFFCLCFAAAASIAVNATKRNMRKRNRGKEPDTAPGGGQTGP